MSVKRRIYSITGTSPASPTTAVVGTAISGLDQYAWFMIDAKLIGGTGGTLDVYLQRSVTDSDGTQRWVDWLHFPQVAAGATKYYSATPTASAGITEVGTGTSPVIAANSFIGGHPGSAVRCIATGGAGTSAGGAQVITLTCFGGNE